MGIDYYTCQSCNEAFPDCIEYFVCETCETMFCSGSCGGRKYDEEDNISCVLCRKEQATDSNLLHFLIRHYKLSYEQVFKMYQEEKEDE